MNNDEANGSDGGKSIMDMLGEMLGAANSVRPVNVGGMDGLLATYGPEGGCKDPKCTACDPERKARWEELVDGYLESSYEGLEEELEATCQKLPMTRPLISYIMNAVGDARQMSVPDQDLMTITRYIAATVEAAHYADSILDGEGEAPEAPAPKSPNFDSCVVDEEEFNRDFRAVSEAYMRGVKDATEANRNADIAGFPKDHALTWSVDVTDESEDYVKGLKSVEGRPVAIVD